MGSSLSIRQCVKKSCSTDPDSQTATLLSTTLSLYVSSSMTKAMYVCDAKY